MAMNAAYRNALAAYGAGLARYIGLVDAAGRELSGSGYARRQVTWSAPVDGTVRPTEDLIFTIPGQSTVAGWRAYDAKTGGSSYGGHSLPAESFNGAGEYRLLAAGTGILHGGS